jgi:autotransporter-associated beta strand protein
MELNAANAITGGTQSFTDSAALNANVANALNAAGQTISFDIHSRLNANAANAVNAGTQNFIGYSSHLNAHAANSVSGGTQNFVGGSNFLNANAGNAVSGGQQNFQSDGKMFVFGANGLSGGTQTFEDSSRLVLFAANQFGSSTQTFSGDSSLWAQVSGSVGGGQQTFADYAMLFANGEGAITGGVQTFSGGSGLETAAERAVSGGSQIFFNSAQMNVYSANGVTGGLQVFFNDAELKTQDVGFAGAVAGGTQHFHNNSVLRPRGANGVTGGTQIFHDDATLSVAQAGSVNGGNITLMENSAIVALFNADTLTRNTNITFDSTDGGPGGRFFLNGQSNTVGRLGSVGNAAGVISNGDQFGQSFGQSAILTVNFDGAASTYTGLIEDGVGGGALSLAKAGNATLVLTAVHAFSGDVFLDGGVLKFDYTNTNLAPTLTRNNAGLLANGGALEIVGQAGKNITQTFSALVLGGGATRIKLDPNGATSLLLNLGNFEVTGYRNLGATVDFTAPAGSSIVHDTVAAGSAPFGWATASNGSTWATFTGGTVGGLSSYGSTWGAGQHTDVTAASAASTAPASGAVTNTLRFNETAANTVTLSSTITIESGGVLVTGNVGNHRTALTGGALTTGNVNNDLVIHQYNTAEVLQIDSDIVNNGNGPTALTKSGPGTLILNGAKSYTGATFINEGKLLTSGVIAGDTTIQSGGYLGGNATVQGKLVVKLGGTVAPGNSPGTITAEADAEWGGDGNYVWELNDTLGTVGADSGWDLLSVAGLLEITATAGDRFTLDLRSLTLANGSGDPANFDPLLDYAWTIASAGGGVSGFDAEAFEIVRSGFTGTADGTFGVALNGNDVQVTYTPTPEPGTAALLLGSLGFLGVTRRRPRVRL